MAVFQQASVVHLGVRAKTVYVSLDSIGSMYV